MTPADLLAALRKNGCRLGLSFTAEGMTPTFGGRLTDEDRQALAAHRDALVSLLLAEARQAAEAQDDDEAAVNRVVEFDDPMMQFWDYRQKKD